MGRKPGKTEPRIDYADLPGGGLLRNWREAAGLGQQEAADMIGIDLARYNGFENWRGRPGIDWAQRIAKVTKGRVPVSAWTVEPEAVAS